VSRAAAKIPSKTLRIPNNRTGPQPPLDLVLLWPETAGLEAVGGADAAWDCEGVEPPPPGLTDPLKDPATVSLWTVCPSAVQSLTNAAASDVRAECVKGKWSQPTVDNELRLLRLIWIRESIELIGAVGALRVLLDEGVGAVCVVLARGTLWRTMSTRR
jgi:hypothetical protein